MELYKFPCKLLPKEPFVDYPAFVGSFIFVGSSTFIFSSALPLKAAQSMYWQLCFCRQPCLCRQICPRGQKSFFFFFSFFPVFAFFSFLHPFLSLSSQFVFSNFFLSCPSSLQNCLAAYKQCLCAWTLYRTLHFG